MSSARSRARRLAVQGLYEWQITGTGIAEIKQRFLEGKEARKIDEDYFRELIEGVINQVVELDQHITPFLNRSLQEVDEVEKAILRLATYELAHRPDIPYRVIINEGVELAKTFGAEQGHKFINGMLDKIAARLRPVEMSKAKKS